MAAQSGQQVSRLSSAEAEAEFHLTVVADHSTHTRWAEDRVLVAAACDGEIAERQQAFGRLVERYQGFLRNLLYGLCRNQDLADELAQESFVLAWQKLPSLRDRAKFQGWLKQLAYRQFLHQQRHQGVIDRHYQAQRSQSEAVDGELSEPVHAGEDWLRLTKPCSALEQELLVLLFGVEFSYAEIARERDMPVGTVKSHIHRAKAKIAEYLQEAEES